MTPQRVQLSRRKGWRLPANTTSVARPTKWGNPYRVATGCQSTDLASRTIVTLMFQALTARDDPLARESVHTAPYPTLAEIRDQLAGKNLACWCPLPEPGQPDWCHAAVLLRLANEREP